MNSPLKWHGGKYYLAPWIVSNFPSQYTHYVEPYFGSGAVLLALPAGKSECANDLDGDVIHFFRTLAAQPDEFIRRANLMPFHEGAWNLTGQGGDDVYRALAFFVRIRQSYQGLGKTFAARSRSRTRGGRNEQVNAWMNAVDSLLPVATRLLDVCWLSQEAREVIRAEDSPHTLFYLDPPYHPSTRTVTDAYAHEMTHEQHADLLRTILLCKGKVCISGYRCELYDTMLAGWRRIDRRIDNKSGKTHEMRTESVWCNYV